MLEKCAECSELHRQQLAGLYFWNESACLSELCETVTKYEYYWSHNAILCISLHYLLILISRAPTIYSDYNTR
jgi:hypothetical protein